jgi:hypothetical protein
LPAAAGWIDVRVSIVQWPNFSVIMRTFSAMLANWDGNGRKNHISTSVSIFFGGNGSGFRKCGFENGIEICGHTETDKYRWSARKLN